MVLLSGLERMGGKSNYMSPAHLLEQLDQYLRKIFEAEKDKFASRGAESVLCLTRSPAKITESCQCQKTALGTASRWCPRGDSTSAQNLGPTLQAKALG